MAFPALSIVPEGDAPRFLLEPHVTGSLHLFNVSYGTGRAYVLLLEAAVLAVAFARTFPATRVPMR